MTDLNYCRVDEPTREDLDIISVGIRGWNRQALGDYDEDRFALLATDATGEIVGGAYATLKWGWLHVRSLWVHQDQRGRGVGSRLIAMAEEAASAAGVDKCRLETFDFQALDFYLKNGYQIFAWLEGSPADHTHYFLKKENLGAPRQEPGA